MTLPRLQPCATSRDAVRQLLNGGTLRTCTPAALLVGTVLPVVDQADVVLTGIADLLVPFLVSSSDALLVVPPAPPQASAVSVHGS